MMKRIVTLALGAAAMAASAGPAFAAGNAAKGKSLFQAQCAACHSVQKGQNGIGPSLYGVYGQPAADAPGCTNDSPPGSWISSPWKPAR